MARYQSGHIFEGHGAMHVRYYVTEIVDGQLKRTQRSERLCAKDGTILNVTDYWLIDDQLHFTMIEENGTKPAEHVISTHWICKRPLMQTRGEDSALCYATNHSSSICATTLKARHPS